MQAMNNFVQNAMGESSTTMSTTMSTITLYTTCTACTTCNTSNPLTSGCTTRC